MLTSLLGREAVGLSNETASSCFLNKSLNAGFKKWRRYQELIIMSLKNGMKE